MNRFSFQLVLLCLAASLLSVRGDRLSLAEDRQPVPAIENQEAAGELIRNVYGDEYAAARTSAQQLELAQKLLEEAQATTDNPTGRYVLFRIARDIAAQHGDLDLTFQAIDLLEQDYEVDALAMKVETTETALGEVRTGYECQAVSEAVEGTIDEAVSASRFDLAGELAQACVEAARRARDRDAVRAWAARMHEIEDLANQYAIIEAAMAKLEEDPTDAEANSVVGSYQCFVLGDWEQGLPMLALGSDSELQQLAEAELGDVIDAAAMKSLGDSWWDYGESLEGTEQEAVRQRAAHWYTQALPDLAGLTRAQIEQRIEEAGPQGGQANGRFDYSQATLRHAVPTNGYYFIDVTFSPDDEMVAVAGDSNYIKIFDVGSGQETARLEGHQNQTVRSVFSPAGGILASMSSADGVIKLWDLERGQDLVTIQGGSYPDVTFSADGSLLAYGGQGSTVRLWNVREGREVASLAGHTGRVNTIRFSPDARSIASSGDDHMVLFWDLSDGHQTGSIPIPNPQHSDPIAFSPDGELIAVAGSVPVLPFFSARSGEVQFSLAAMPPVLFSPDGSIVATGSPNGAVLLWDVSSRRQIATLEPTFGRLFDLAFSQDGRFLAAVGEDDRNELVIWEFAEQP